MHDVYPRRLKVQESAMVWPCSPPTSRAN